MLNVLSWSGGKDSTASVILDHTRNGHKVDLIITCLNYFDKSREIFADHPKHIDFVFYAKKVFESWGYKVVIVSSEHDYLYWFYKIRTNRCRHKEYVGKYYGWLLASMCKMQGEKVKPIKEYLKGLNCEFTEVVGIGIDESERLARVHKKKGQISLLEKFNMTTKDAKELCEKYNLLSPLYEKVSRQGCWFCPNQNIKEFANLKKEYPNLWAELEKLAEEKNICTKNFTYGKTFEQVKNEICEMEKQISMFDLI